MSNLFAPLRRDRYHHTDRQVQVLEESHRKIVDLYKLMVNARELHDSTVDLGSRSEDGDVVRHDANMDLCNVRDVLLNAAQQLKWTPHVNRDYFDLINYSVRFVGTRFVSEKVMETEMKHLLDYIPVLEEKLGIKAERRKIRLLAQIGSYASGSTHEVIEVVNHGGHSDDSLQYVIRAPHNAQVYHVLESKAEVVA